MFNLFRRSKVEYQFQEPVVDVKRSSAQPAPSLSISATDSDYVEGAIARIAGKAPLSTMAYVTSKAPTSLRIARNLFRTNPVARAFVNNTLANVVGPAGFKFSCSLVDRNGNLAVDLNASVEKAINDFFSNPCVNSRLTMIDVLNHIQTQELVEGEYFVKLHKGAPTRTGFAVEFIPSECLPFHYTSQDTNGNRIINSITVDGWNRPIAYHVQADVSYKPANVDSAYHVVPADSMLHGVYQAEPNQVRGISGFEAAITTLTQMAEYHEATIAAARIAASQTGFFTRNNPDGSELPDNIELHVKPGSYSVLPDNYSFAAHTPVTPSAAYADVSKQQMRNCASALNVSYNSLANDLSDTNYSSIRSGMLQERSMFKTLQTRRTADLRFLVDAYLRYLVDSKKLDIGLTTVDAIMESIVFVGRGFEWVDPEKDANAMIALYDAGLTSKTAILRERGVDYEDVLLQRKKEDELAKSYAALQDKVASNNDGGITK